MKTNIDNVLATIEDARTRLQRLSQNSPEAKTLNEITELLSSAATALQEADVTKLETTTALPETVSQSKHLAQTANFTRIKNIDAALAANLHTAGVSTYDDMVAWQATDVAKHSSQLSLGSRINQENWIEQAAILAKGGETRYARLLPPSDPIPATIAPVPVPVEVAIEAAVTTPSEPPVEITTEMQSDQNTPEPMAPEKMAPETKTLDVESAPYDAKIDDREATIEIVNRPDHQNAYPNTSEDPSEVVKRFLRALTGDAETEGEQK